MNATFPDFPFLYARRLRPLNRYPRSAQELTPLCVESLLLNMATKLFLLLIFGASPTDVSSVGIGGGRGKSFMFPVMLLKCRLELAGRPFNDEKCDAVIVFDIELGRFAVWGRVGNLLVSRERLKVLLVPLVLFIELKRCICNACAVPVVVPFVVMLVGFEVC